MLSEATLDLIEKALAEDVGTGDITTEAVVPSRTRTRARIDQKAPGVLFGLDVAEATFRMIDPKVSWRPLREEGDWLDQPPAAAVALEGEARALVTGERVALNFLQHLSGIATAAATAVRALNGSGIEVLDTRKTVPGLRELEKQAVAAGGGRNHRMGLYDAVLVKDNHVALAGSITEAVRRALENALPGIEVEVECDTLDDVREAVDAGASHLLLDNMTLAEMAEAREIAGPGAVLEASGGFTPESLPGLAEARLDFVSLGFLTHSAPALDLSMSIQPLDRT